MFRLDLAKLAFAALDGNRSSRLRFTAIDEGLLPLRLPDRAHRFHGCAIFAANQVLHFDAGVQNSALLGLAKHWGNTHHGMLFDQVCLGQYANPVIVLDEIDKAERYINGNALNALHSVLEPSTAVSVTDVSLDVTFDANLVTYIATANRVDRIAESLLSRFRVIPVAAPDARQAIAIAESVIAATLPKICPPGFVAPDRQVVLAVAHVTARALRQALEAAVACAVESGRSYLTLRDFDGLLDTGGDGTRASLLH